MRRFISDQTYISLGIVISFIGAVVWLTTLYFQTDANAKALLNLSQQQENYNQNLLQINTRLSRIEGALHVEH